MLQKRLLGVFLGGLVLSNTAFAGFSGLLGKLNDLVNEIKLVVTADRYQGSIAVQVAGAHRGNGAVILPYGARLKDVVVQLEPSSLANVNNLTIYRESVRVQQKEAISRALDRLEEMTLATQSTIKEEAQLRSEDAKLVEQFIAKAIRVESAGRVVVLPNSWRDIILEQGDVIHIPSKTSVITVNGQIRTQGVLTYDAHLTVGDYIAKSWGVHSMKSRVF